jgi:primosomal protein N' (replication factor Y)
VIVQTFVPSHYAVRPVRDHDFEGFYAEELTHRSALGYPPFGRVAQVIVSAEDEELAQQGAARLAAAIARAPGCQTLGPAPAPLAKLRDRHRQQLLLKGDAASVHAAARRLVEASRDLPDAIQTSVDVDPVHML